jgi:hypothetical protein
MSRGSRGLASGGYSSRDNRDGLAEALLRAGLLEEALCHYDWLWQLQRLDRVLRRRCRT